MMSQHVLSDSVARRRDYLTHFDEKRGSDFSNEYLVPNTVSRNKICFVSQNIYPCLSETIGIQSIGGAELQQKYISASLRDQGGYEVSVVSMDHGQHDGEICNGIRIFKSFKPEEGIFGIRFFYPRLLKTWKAIKRADADIYYTRCADFIVGILALFCKIYGRKLIYAAAHDTDFVPHEVRLPTARDRVLYKYGLRHADVIIVQSNQQKTLLWENFRLNAAVIPNVCPFDTKELDCSQRKYILWVSTIRDWKRPEQFLRLAELFPHEQFVMIGGRAYEDSGRLYDETRNMAETLGNLRFMGFQPFHVTETYFDQCKVFVNTSKYEGFPNTFLQAWRRGTPVISYVDPDNVIKTHRLGRVIGSEREFCVALSDLIRPSSCDSGKIRNYFAENHSSKILDQYVLLAQELSEA